MNLDGARQYFNIEHRYGIVYVIIDRLEGAAFMEKNRDGLERLTLDGIDLRRSWEWVGKMSVYTAEQPKSLQPTNS